MNARLLYELGQCRVRVKKKDKDSAEEQGAHIFGKQILSEYIGGRICWAQKSSNRIVGLGKKFG